MILKRGNITPAACANGLHTVTAKKTHARKRTERNGKNAISRNGTPIPERDGSRKERRSKMDYENLIIKALSSLDEIRLKNVWYFIHGIIKNI